MTPEAVAADPAVLVRHASANELKPSNGRHPYRYKLHKTNEGRSTTKEIVETKDGDVARLLDAGGHPLPPEENQAEVERLNVLTQFKEVKAPFAGTIVQRSIDIGNLVTAGSTASTSSLYRISLDDPIRVFVDAPQSAAAQLLEPGVGATVTTNGLPPRHFEGKVARTSMSINARARTLKVEIDIPNADRGLVPGMYVQTAFQMKSSGVAQIPAAGLTFRTNGPQVAVVDGEGRVRFRNVGIGADDGSVVQITDGLKAGESVVLNLSSQITDGETVRTNDAEPERSTSASTTK